MRKKIFLFKFLISILLSIISSFALAVDNQSSNIQIFSLKNYSQDVNFWLDPKSSDYKTNLLTTTYQVQRFNELKHNYYGTGANDYSPWSEGNISFLLHEKNTSLNTLEQNLFDGFLDNITLDIGHDKKYIDSLTANSTMIDPQRIYGINFQPYSKLWFNRLYQNMQLIQLKNLEYDGRNRAIATNNIALRSLPTDDPFFHDYKIAGEGYPFDSLQQTTVYAGTPLYILGSTVDKKWNLVLTPDYVGWVHANVVANVNDDFVLTWRNKAIKNLVGITQSNISIINQYQEFAFTAYVGMVFPLNKMTDSYTEILIPFKEANGMARILKARLSNTVSTTLPLAASKENFAKIFLALKGRTYGWGGLNNYNDCSAEMKAIFTMLGIYLPRNTSEQSLAGITLDLSKEDEEHRINNLMQKGKPLLTLVYIKGHIFLYVGNYTDSNGNKFALSYQNMWGLKPRDQSYRMIVGKSVFFPIIQSYPEDTKLISHAGWSNFTLIDLSQMPKNRVRLTFNNLIK